MTLNKYLVEALVEAGLSWGGLFGGGRDVCTLTLIRALLKAKNAALVKI